MPAVIMIAKRTPDVVLPKRWIIQRIMRFATGVFVIAAVMPKDAKMKKVTGFE